MLEIRGLNQFYGGSHTLRGVDLEVPQGSCTALLGRNGVGKTTLLRCLMGMLPVRSGSVVFAGTDLMPLKPYQRARLGIGYVPQGREIFPRLSVAENLSVGEAAAAERQELESQRELEALFPGLRAMRSRPGGNLSGGQQQQLAVARALIARPKLLLLDEPTEGIQPSIIKQIGSAIDHLRRSGEIAILLVEQYFDFAKELADRFFVMDRGEIVLSGRGEEMNDADVRRLMSV